MVSPSYLVEFLSRLGTPSLSTFDDRLKAQKFVYLAQENGASFSFAFGWYAHGPYSPSLTRSLFSIASDNSEFPEVHEAISEQDERVARHLSEFFGSKRNDIRYIELVASVWYFLPSGTITKEKKHEVIERLSREKPKFKQLAVRQAIEKIISFRAQAS